MNHGSQAANAGLRSESGLDRGTSLVAKAIRMSVLDLVKATITCGGIAFLVYSFPALSQGVIIGVLTLLWLSYATRTVLSFRRR
jgi:hypothetical protein